ncbi:MAG: EamA family transporter [Sphingomonadales bacterium]|nr:MAG: EamA family transporter [Sphingomonadales bacterium]
MSAAILSAVLGGTAIVATRYLADAIDPLTIGSCRFAGGFLILLPLALIRKNPWPPRGDRIPSAALGLCMFGLFPLLFNLSLVYTTAARGALALATAPLITVVASAAFGIERATLWRSIGVLIATAGVAVTLGSSLRFSPPGAWRGDLLMVAAACCLTVYKLSSHAYVSRTSALSFTAFGMGFGAAALVAGMFAFGDPAGLQRLAGEQWLALGYLVVVGGALIYFLIAYALGLASPTLVSASVTLNPVTAGILGVYLLGERFSFGLLAGSVAILGGIFLAQRGSRPVAIK